MEKCGFQDVAVLSEQGMGPDWLRLYPIFTGEFIDLLCRHLPAERQDDTILAVFLRGYKI